MVLHIAKFSEGSSTDQALQDLVIASRIGVKLLRYLPLLVRLADLLDGHFASGYCL